MTKTTRISWTALILSAGAFPAFAADLPPIYETPIYTAAPELQPVEIGNGWYLRGDVGYGFESKTDSKWSIDHWDHFNTTKFGSGRYKELELEDNAEFSVGAGYTFNHYLRTDITASRYESEIGLADGSYDNVRKADLTAWELMANAYVDLGTFVGFTPYVGAGAGATHIAIEENNCSYNGGGCDLGGLFTYESHEADDWRFTYSLMAGVAYDLTQNLKLDVGYKFSDIEGGSMPSNTVTHIGDGDEFRMKQEDDGFQRHAVRVGVRYSLW